MFFFFFKQKTAYEMRISDWSSDVCSSDLHFLQRIGRSQNGYAAQFHANVGAAVVQNADGPELGVGARFQQPQDRFDPVPGADQKRRPPMCAVSRPDGTRSEEHTSELQSLMRNSYAVFCLKKKKKL